MTTTLNRKSTLPVSLAANYKGYSIAGLYKLFARETGSTYSYTMFHGCSSGRWRVGIIENWLINEGFGVELKKAQKMHRKKA